MKYHSSECPEPETVKVKCRECGSEFEEFVTVWLTFFLIGGAPLICINCDREAEAQACCWVDTVRMVQ